VTIAWRRVSLGAVLALAAVNFAWQLGSSSYFVDEILSIGASGVPPAHLLHSIAHNEIAPPAYFFFQHEWLARTGTEAEWVMRLPSVLAGVLLVATVWWIAATISTKPWVPAAAGALAAVSPLLLQYAQLAQGYMPAALAASVAVAAAFAAQGSRRASGRLLACSALAAVLALGTNYTAALVVAPLCWWVFREAAFPARWRMLHVAACAVVQVALLPLFIAQWHYEPGRKGVGHAADLSATNVLRMIEAPFDGRVNALRFIGVAVVVVSLAALALRWRGLGSRRRLVLLIAVGEPLVLLLLSAFGARVAITRYAVVAAPFMLLALALGVASLPRALGVLVSLAALLVCIVGTAKSHQRSGFYVDMRSAMDYIAQRERPGDVVIAPASPGLSLPLEYYRDRRLHPFLPDLRIGDPAADPVLFSHRRLWVVSDLAGKTLGERALLAAERPYAAHYRHVPRLGRSFDSRAPLAVALWTPARR
jgi:hypothetical protein